MTGVGLSGVLRSMVSHLLSQGVCGNDRREACVRVGAVCLNSEGVIKGMMSTLSLPHVA